MRTITLEPKEFIQFKAMANAISLFFDFRVVKGFIHVVADAQQLDMIGY